MPFVGVDLGTSFIKGAVLDLDNARFTHVRRIPFPDPIPDLDPLLCEYDPRQILTVVSAFIQELADLAAPCDGLVMCTQMHTTVLIDGSNKVHSNCIGWRDQRATMPHPSGQGSYYEHYQRRISAVQRRELGNESPVGSPASFLFCLAEQGKLEAGLTPVTLADFVLSKMCGSQPAVETTNAMAYELLNLTTMKWHSQVIEQLGLKDLQWPKLLAQGEVVGSMVHKDRRIPCYTPVGDYQCALAGAMLEPEELSLNISTGSQVSRVTDVLDLGDYQSRPFFDGKFTNTLTHLPAGRSLNVLVDLLTELGRSSGTPVQDPWLWIRKAADTVSKTDLKVKLSFFPGPCGDKGAISNVGERNLTVGALFRSAFEDMAENYYSCAQCIWPDRSWRNLLLSGGMAHKLPPLRRLIEDRFQSETRLCEVTEDTLSGLLMMALAFSGNADSLGGARAIIQRRNVRPNMETVKSFGDE